MVKNNHKGQAHHKGFTIIELLVVIVVIGILTAVTVVSYGGVSQKAIGASLRADLTNASKKLEMYKVEYDAYPASLTAVDIGTTIGFTYIPENTPSPQTYSLFASKNNIQYFVTNNSKPAISTQIEADGPYVTKNGYRIHTFTSSGTFNVTSGNDYVDVLVVAGGGGGGSSKSQSGGGGGGGAGGLIYTRYYMSPQSIVVTVGAGGAPGGSGLEQKGVAGENSSFGDKIIAKGGGYGGNNKVGIDGNGGDGGSGGGGGYNGYTSPRTGGKAEPDQGYNGGSTTYFSSPTVNTSPCPVGSYCGARGASGGGAGGYGKSNEDVNINKSGPGLPVLITGSSVTYAAGGKGGNTSGISASTPNTGNGGSAAYGAGTAYAGASGIVIVRYKHN